MARSEVLAAILASAGEQTARGLLRPRTHRQRAAEDEVSGKLKRRDPLLATLVGIYPDAEPAYLRHCLSQYDDHEVERVVEKIQSANRGEYPRRQEGVDDPNSVEAKNRYLLTLNEMFPDCDISYLRDRVLRTEYDHVRAVAEQLVSSGADYPRRLRPGRIEARDFLRPPEYVKGATELLCNEFPTAWKSAVRAAMAEVNNDYVESHYRLREIERRTSGWLNRLCSLLKRRPFDSPEMWCPELLHDVELLRASQMAEQSERDREVARDINKLEYEESGQLIACGCCFDDFAFEDLCACEDGHLFCVNCVRRYIAEGLFGTGCLRGRPVPCMDASSGGSCLRNFPDSVLRAVLAPDAYAHYCDSVVEEELRRARLRLVRCPFCVYCEVDETSASFRPFRRSSLPIALLYFGFSILLSCLLDLRDFLCTLATTFLVFSSISTFLGGIGAGGLLAGSTPRREWDALCRKLQRPRASQLFRCLAPDCGKTSCLKCGLEATSPMHKCHEKAQDGLRLYVERAMAAVHLRTCPRCQVSFEKVDGCNKMTCRCGYVMCYVCRKDIRQESYAHFCDHFRPIPGEKCSRCRKCDLYKVEDEEAAIKVAADRARREFLNAHPELCSLHWDLLDERIGPPAETVDVSRALRALNELIIDKVINFFLN